MTEEEKKKKQPQAMDEADGVVKDVDQIQTPVVNTSQQTVTTSPVATDGGQKVEQPKPWGGLISWDEAEKAGLTWEDLENDPSKYLRNKDAKWNYGQMIADHARWEQSQGRTPDYFRYLASSQGRDLSKNPVEEEKEKKRKQREDFFEGLGYALMSLGNFIGATQGAPAPTNEGDPTEYSKRQQALRDKTEALRTAYNKDYFANYWKMRDEESKQKRADLEERKVARLEEETRIRAAKNEAYSNYLAAMQSKNQEQAAYWAEKTRALEEGLPLEQAKKRAEIAAKNAAAALSSAKANNERNGITTTTTNADGSTKTVYKTPAGRGGAQTNSAPPSRRSTQQSNNVPPSRRKQ
jgi:hypothetical protein